MLQTTLTFLQLEGIEHRTTQIRRPQSNGYLERFHRTFLDEHLRIQGRKTWYEDLPQFQTDLDGFLKTYNNDRLQQGCDMNGRNPVIVFTAGIKPQPESQNTSAV